MAVSAKRLDQAHCRGDMRQRNGVALSACHGRSLARLGRTRDHNTHSERTGDLFIKCRIALQQLIHQPQETSRLRALDHPMIVGARHRHDLGQAELLDGRRVHRRELGRIRDRSGGDDAALAWHQSGHRRHGTEPARVGQRHRGAGEIVGQQLVVARLVDDRFVGRQEFGKAEGIGALEHRDHQAARPVFALDIHGEPEIDVNGNHLERVGAALEDASAHHRELPRALHQCPRDQVRV